MQFQHSFFLLGINVAKIHPMWVGWSGHLKAPFNDSGLLVFRSLVKFVTSSWALTRQTVCSMEYVEICQSQICLTGPSGGWTQYWPLWGDGWRGWVEANIGRLGALCSSCPPVTPNKASLPSGTHPPDLWLPTACGGGWPSTSLARFHVQGARCQVQT